MGVDADANYAKALSPYMSKNAEIEQENIKQKTQKKKCLRNPQVSETTQSFILMRSHVKKLCEQEIFLMCPTVNTVEKLNQSSISAQARKINSVMVANTKL